MSTEFFEKLAASARKTGYYVRSGAGCCVPRGLWRLRRDRLIAGLTSGEYAEAEARAEYYCRLAPDAGVGSGAGTVGDYGYRPGVRHSTYVFDLERVVRYFPADARLSYLFGDVIHEPDTPTIVKSRPIASGYTNSVVLNLDRHRHFRFIDDRTPWSAKRPMIVSRNVVFHPKRRRLLELWLDHPMCNLGAVNYHDAHLLPDGWLRERMPIAEQLTYKFISCIEGNDVATNMKWVMSSNSIAVCPRPEYETWFMEGTLRPDYHYIEICPDYSDLIDKMQFYIDHPAAAEAIIRNAHTYVDAFRNRRVELAAGILTFERYLYQTHQK